MSEAPGKRRALLDATMELIAAQGFHATPMSQIADHADIGVGTIYRYFKNKEELLNALYLDLKQRIQHSVFPGIDISAPLKTQFEGYMKNFLRYAIDHPLEFQFTEQYENSPLITDSTKRQAEEMSSPLHRLFDNAIAENLFKELPFATIVALFSGATIHLLKLYRDAPPSERDMMAAIDAIWDMLASQS